ncbi:MAG: hypothetical protein EXS24_02170 [Pedosphaera sp.]|nr:hypothetical protein [Pedosphaera sp.]
MFLNCRRTISCASTSVKRRNSISTASNCPPQSRASPAVPADFKKALAANSKAKVAFDAFSPSCRHEYIEWITDAKREETQQRRIATTLEWLKGKKRNWKYS